jgi:hypothetical protein
VLWFLPQIAQPAPWVAGTKITPQKPWLFCGQPLKPYRILLLQKNNTNNP